MTNPGKARGVRYHETRALLHERFPLAFPARGEQPVPLKLHIDVDLHSLPDLGVGRKRLAEFLHFWTGRREYLTALTRGGVRIGLVGQVYGVVTEAHIAHARAALAAKVRPAAQPGEEATA